MEDEVKEMVAINRTQADFYDGIEVAERSAKAAGYSHNERANLITRFWAALRYRQQHAVSSARIKELVDQRYLAWSSAVAGRRVLEIGCFRGSDFTFLLAEQASEYVGLELSPAAVESLNGELSRRGLAGRAKAIAADFLSFPEDGTFDAVYAHGVLHHFKYPEPLFAKVHSLLRPGGTLMFVEPSAVNVFYRLLRACYRPFQSDRAWEWPFTGRTIRALESRFSAIEAFGWGAISAPLSVALGVPLMGHLLRPIYRAIIRREVLLRGSAVWWNSMVVARYTRKES